MGSVCFVGTYQPIMCGIADYTSFITRKSPVEKWGVLTFDLERYGAPLTGNDGVSPNLVWYGIPGREDFSASVILEGLKQLWVGKGDKVLWFQHETAIWADSNKFVAMLRHLDIPKVVTLHTLHFQSPETIHGLRNCQYGLLQALLPHVEAITVFSQGVYRAVTTAFPQYQEKVHVIKHGVHSYPDITCLSRAEAKEKINDFLLYESDLDQSTKEALHRQRIFLDPETVILGQSGFLCPFKHSESLYAFRDSLQTILPHARIVAIRIGSPREESHKTYAGKLRYEHNSRDKFLLEVWLPRNILPLAQRAFDINFYWPSECTQSGILAHALGAGAIVAGRDLEGVGETLREAGELVDEDLGRLMLKIRNLILNPELVAGVEEMAMGYAARYSWDNQALKHYELAESVLSSGTSRN